MCCLFSLWSCKATAQITITFNFPRGNVYDSLTVPNSQEYGDFSVAVKNLPGPVLGLNATDQNRFKVSITVTQSGTGTEAVVTYTIAPASAQTGQPTALDADTLAQHLCTLMNTNGRSTFAPSWSVALSCSCSSWSSAFPQYTQYVVRVTPCIITFPPQSAWLLSTSPCLLHADPATTPFSPWVLIGAGIGVAVALLIFLGLRFKYPKARNNEY